MLAQLVDIYITTTTIARGQAIEQQSVRQLAVDFGQASVQQRITEEQLYSAVARRNLQEGAILSLSDLQFSSTALVATTVLEQGGARDALELFVDFRGRAPTVTALLQQEGIL